MRLEVLNKFWDVVEVIRFVHIRPCSFSSSLNHYQFAYVSPSFCENSRKQIHLFLGQTGEMTEINKETTTFQLGWHPAKPLSYVAKLKHDFIKNRGKIYTRWGTRPKPLKAENKTKIKREKRKGQQTTKIYS